MGTETTATNRRQRHAAATKAALFESAVALFNERGYDSVTIEDIAQRAGTAKGSFYTYFRTKSDIIIEQFRAFDDYCRGFEGSLGQYPDALEKMEALTRAQMRYIRDQVGLAMLKILFFNNITEPGGEKILIDPNRCIQKLMEELIQEGQEKGLIRKDVPPARLGSFLNRSFRSVYLDWAISNNGFDLVKEGMEYYRILILPSLRPL